MVRKFHIALLSFALIIFQSQACFAGNFLENINEGLKKISNDLQNASAGNRVSQQEELSTTPNQKGDKTLNTLLVRAFYNRDIDMATEALRRGANPNYTENGYYGSTPFFMAIENKNIDMLKLLVSYGVDINMKIFQNNGDNTAVLDALRVGSFDILQFVVENGAKINMPLSERMAQRWTAMVSFSSKDMKNQTNVDMFRYLLSKGADIKVKNQSGTTLLMSSVDSENVELTRIYLELGLDPNQRNDYGKNALDFAINRNNRELIKILLPLTKTN